MQDIVVQISRDFKDIDVNFSKLKKLVKAVCSRFKLSKATVSIAIVADSQIRKLNKQFLNRCTTTDCLSFDLSGDDKKNSYRGLPLRPCLCVSRRKSRQQVPTQAGAAGKKGETAAGRSKKTTRLFELVVNAEKAVKQASLRGHSGEAELALYITHGLLHNLGFDDSKRQQAKKMHETEDEILQQFGYGPVYNPAGSGVLRSF